jgi:hypothetical protein
MSKLTRNLAPALIALALSLGFQACSGTDDDPSPGGKVPVTGVTVSPKTVTLAVGGSRELVETVLPANATNQDTHWTSSNEDVARLSLNASNNVVVTGVSAGTATVTVRTDDGNKTDTCAVTVTGSSGPATVYVAGLVGNPETGSGRATLWTNGVPTQLSDAASEANAVWVSGNTVYVAGYQIISGTYRPTLWTNGAATLLGTENGAVSRLFVSGSDVYAVGPVGTPLNTNNERGTLWKNGAVAHRFDGSRYVGTRGLFVSGSDVYVSGSEQVSNTQQVATIWKNNVAERLSSSLSFGYADSVFVSGGDVYASGYVDSANDSRAAFWKNGALTRLSSNRSTGSSVFVSGGNVYVFGNEMVSNANNATIWKDGAVLQRLGGSTGTYHGLVSGGDTYVAGIEWSSGEDRAVVWKNGVATQLNTGRSEARCVFVAQ